MGLELQTVVSQHKSDLLWEGAANAKSLLQPPKEYLSGLNASVPSEYI